MMCFCCSCVRGRAIEAAKAARDTDALIRLLDLTFNDLGNAEADAAYYRRRPLGQLPSMMTREVRTGPMTIKLTARQHADLRGALRKAVVWEETLAECELGLFCLHHLASAAQRKRSRAAAARAVRYAALDDYLEQAGRKVGQ